MLGPILLSLLLTGPVQKQALTTKLTGSIEVTLRKELPREGAALAAQIARLIQWRGDITRDPRRGDTMSLIFANEPEPKLYALRYTGQRIDLEGVLFPDENGIERYYNQAGHLIEPMIQSPPVPLYHQVTETVNQARGKRQHRGIDMKAPRGTPVHAPFEAKVRRVNWRQRYNGKCIELVYKTGHRARFLHLDSIKSQVRVGKTIQANQVIGTVGSTGRSGPPHLHYEILSEKGLVLDPLKIHGTQVISVAASKRNALREQLKKYRAQLAHANGQ